MHARARAHTHTHTRAQAAANPSNTLYDVKRIIGQCFSHSGVQLAILTLAGAPVALAARDDQERSSRSHMHSTSMA